MNKHEYEALENEYLSHEARTLYVLCLRRYMDYSNGLVGTAKRRVSYQQFKEYLSVSRPRRSTIPPFIPSTQQLRGYVEELVRTGLVARMPKQSKTDPMVFRLPLATTDTTQTDFFQSNEEQHLSNKGQQQRQQQVEQQARAQQKQGFTDYEQQAEQQQEQHLSNIEEQHTSVTSDYSHTHSPVEDFDARFGGTMDEPAHVQSTKVQSISGARRFPMHGDWQPDNTFTDQALTLGLDLKNLTPEQGEQIAFALVDFKTYWMETRPNDLNTQRLWQQKFIQTSLKRALNNNNSNNRGNDHGHGNRHQPNAGNRQSSSIAKPFTAADFDLSADF